MKKTIMMMSVFLIVWTLSGCELFKGFGEGEVEPFEVFCEKNPEDEQCILREKTVIRDGFLDLYEAYSNDSLDFCEIYLEEEELQEECRFMYDQFLPEDVNEFSYVSLNTNTASGEDQYTLLFENQKENKALKIDFSMVFEDDIYKLLSMSYSVDPLVAYTEEELLLHMEEMIKRDLDLYLEDVSYAATVFPYDDEEERENNWHFMNNNEMSYEIGQYVINDDASYTFYIYGLLDVVRVLNDELLVYPYYEDGELHLSYGWDKKTIEERKTNSALMDLLDYVSFEENSLETIDTVFDIEDESDLADIANALIDSFDYRIISNEEDSYSYNIIISDLYEERILSILFYYNPSIDHYHIRLLDETSKATEDVNFDYLIEEFIEEYNKSQLSLDDIKLYFDVDMPSSLSNYYGDINEKISFYDFFQVEGENKIVLERNRHLLYYSVDFVQDSDNAYQMSFHLEDEIDYELLDRIETDFHLFFEALSKDDTACQTYFSDANSSYCSLLFDNINASEYRFVNLAYMGDYISIQFMYERPDTDNNLFVIHIRYEEGEDNTLHYDLIDSSFEKDDIMNELKKLTDLIESEIDIDLIYQEYSSTNSNLKDFIKDVRDLDYRIEIAVSNISYANSYLVYNVFDSDDVFLGNILLDFDVNRVVDETLIGHSLDVKEVKDISLDVSNEISSYINDMIDDINRNQYTLTEMCYIYQDFFYQCPNDFTMLDFKDYTMTLLESKMYDERNELSITVLIESKNTQINLLFQSALFIYEIDGEIKSEKIYPNLDSLEESIEYLEHEDARKDFFSFLEDMIDESVSSLEIISKYNHDQVYQFLLEREYFKGYSSLEYRGNLLEDKYTSKDLYAFIDEEGEETLVFYTLSDGASSRYSYYVNHEKTKVIPVDINPKDILAYISGEKPTDLILDFEELGPDMELLSHIEEHDYRLQLSWQELNDFSFLAIDSNEEVIYIADYRYKLVENLLNQIVLQGELLDLNVKSYVLISDYLEDLEKDLEEGLIQLEDFNQLTKIHDYIKIDYDEMKIESIELEELSNRGISNSYEVRILYKLDEIDYQSIHTVIINQSEDTTSYSWECTGYLGPDPEGEMASLSEAQTILNQFLNDYFNQDISFNYIKETYFNGMTVEIYTEADRNSLFKDPIAMKFLEVTAVKEDGITIAYELHYTITNFNTVLSEKFNVLKLENDQYYISIID